jgi:hypothetical protein
MTENTNVPLEEDDDFDDYYDDDVLPCGCCACCGCDCDYWDYEDAWADDDYFDEDD